MFPVRRLVCCLVLMAGALARPVMAADGAATPRAALSLCQSPDGGVTFLGRVQSGCEVVAPAAANPPNPERWMPWMGASGRILYLDRQSVIRDGAKLGLVLMRNLPAAAGEEGVIRTARGELVRSSLKRIVFDCLSHTYAVFEQSLFGKRYAGGQPLMTFRYPGGKARPVTDHSALAQLASGFCAPR